MRHTFSGHLSKQTKKTWNKLNQSQNKNHHIFSYSCVLDFVEMEHQRWKGNTKAESELEWRNGRVVGCWGSQGTLYTHSRMAWCYLYSKNFKKIGKERTHFCCPWTPKTYLRWNLMIFVNIRGRGLGGAEINLNKGVQASVSLRKQWKVATSIQSRWCSPLHGIRMAGSGFSNLFLKLWLVF